MLRASCLILPILLGLGSLARSDDAPAAASPKVADPSVAAQPQPSDGQPSATGETWRFRRHRGQWWYWLPSNRWVIWNGSEWKSYEPDQKVVSGNPQARRSYSRSAGTEWGFWGPKYYDKWGNIQYPYSRRRSGLKQLGPVPAMGGVRSLPGWGGER